MSAPLAAAATAPAEGPGAAGRYRVLKFGGSSLVGRDRLEQVVEIVGRERARGPLAVVVSALGDSTDLLQQAASAAAAGDRASAAARAQEVAQRLGEAAAMPALLARAEERAALLDELEATRARLSRLLEGLALVGDCGPGPRDQVLSFGEQLSALVVSALLSASGVPARPIDARSWTVTDDRFGDARVRWPETAQRLAALSVSWRPLAARGVVLVHTGFLGATADGRTTTLGRNGSDYTAALLARGLGAEEVTVWTDVSGVMTADPDLVDEAYPVPRLSYREALELAGLGLKMFHPRTMVPLIESGVPLRIRNTLRPHDPGTLVDATGAPDVERPTCVTSLEGMALIDVEGDQRTEGARLGPRVSAALAVPAWLQTLAPRGNGIALVVDRGDAEAACAAAARELAAEIARGELAPPRVSAPVTLVTLVAEAMGQTVNVAGRFFGALGAIGVNVRAAAQGASSRAISCVVDDGDTAAAVRAVHAAFNLAREQVNVLLLGRGTVGRQLLHQLGAEQAKLRAGHDLDLRLAGLAASGGALLDEAGLDPGGASEELDRRGHHQPLSALLDRLRRLPVPVLVDCTAADGMEALYQEAFSRGIHVVAANKKPLALPLPERDRLWDAARRAHRGYRYETTVGAGLPVIETLKNLVRTGDRVHLVEGSLSGTLGFLSNQVTAGQRLSEAVRVARERGYTEPHPGDDLSGLDAARKALILGRELGLRIELADVAVEPFVPPELLAHHDLDAFFAALADHDQAFAERIDGLRARGQVLRYLARIALDGEGGPRVSVGPVGVPADHPATRLRGSEALVAFTTERYAEYPLVVQGPGAGGAVTAAGVLADVLALSQALRGR